MLPLLLPNETKESHQIEFLQNVYQVDEVEKKSHQIVFLQNVYQSG